MPTGHEFCQEVKQLIFHVIDFVESEKNGPVIPLYNVKDRLVKMLNISERSIYRLTHELHHLRCKETKKILQEQFPGPLIRPEDPIEFQRIRHRQASEHAEFPYKTDWNPPVFTGILTNGFRLR